MENNKFWETIKPFITNKNGLNNNSIILNKDNKSNVKLAKKYLVKPLTKAINISINSSVFSKVAKRAAVSPLDKGGKDKTAITNFRPVSVLNVFSKFYERIMKNQINSFIDSKLSTFLSAYRKSYSTQHVLIRLIEEWKQKLDRNYVVGAILMDLSKAFDSIPHDLIIAKLYLYGFDFEALKLILSYLTDREQATRINSTYSAFQLILPGVPQGSILGPIIFNIFLNDLFYFIEKCNIHNYADDNTLTSSSNSTANLVKDLENDANIAISWLRNNKMIANPDKFQCIILSKNKADNIVEVNIKDQKVPSQTSVKLLGITIDNKLNFNEHISKLCKSASAQPNAIFRLRYKLPFKAKHILINSFVNRNFSYCPLIWHFSSSNSLLKIETIKIRSIRLLSDDGEGNKNLLSELERDSMKVKRLKSICIEIYKTLNDSYMKKIFPIKLQNKPVRTFHEKNLIVPTVKLTTFGTNSLHSMGPKIWNNLPNGLKSSETLSKFKNIIKRYEGIEQILLLYKN